jgi:hypothetical protein
MGRDATPQLHENSADPKRWPPRKGRQDPRSGRNGRSHRAARARGAKNNPWPHARLAVSDSDVGLGAAVSTTGTGVPLALDKSKSNGLKGRPNPLAVTGQTKAPSRGPKTVGGQAPPHERGGSFMGKGSPDGAFNAHRPATARRGPWVARLPRNNNMITGEACSQGPRQPSRREPPLPGHYASSDERRWGGPRHSHLPSRQIDMERSACGPEQCTEKSPGDAQSPGETSEHLGVPRGGPRVATALPHSVGPCLASGSHLQASAPHQAPHSHLRR